ncbi:nucleoside monophosphate kinase [Patescibacteria group bacterium]|nr:nucleoside monophosphate kinase [Patescibacteria group bacterium]
MKRSKKIKNQLVIILLGPPGSGKGTQAELLTEKLNLYHLETSKIIVANLLKAKKGDFVKVKGKKYFLSEEKKLRKSGKWMSPPLITFWVKNKIKELAKEGEGIAISGSPKTLYEGKEITSLLKKLYGNSNFKIILIKLGEKESIWRNTKRRICQLMRHSILYTKETAKLKVCPFDGSKLIFREDSSPRVIKMKLKEYQERTLPLIDYFKKEGLRVKKVNGEQSVEKVFKDILKTLK